MRKVALIVLAVVILLGGCVPAIADNSARIEELKAESQELTNRKAQYEEAIQQIINRLVGIEAIIVELTNMDKPKEEEKKESK